MNRPSHIPQADFDRRDRDLIEACGLDPNLSAAVVAYGPSGLIERAWYTGAWLGEQLRALGCPQDLRSRICFEHGGNVVDAADPWADTQHLLAEYKAGRWKDPGAAMHSKKMRQPFPTVMRMRDATLRRGGEEAPSHDD
jgi:hypothetical protein